MDNSFWVNYGEYIVGVPVFIIGTAVTIWIFIKQKNKKRLEYRVIANESLLSYKKDLEKDLIVTYKNQKVNSLVLFSVTIQNTGNVPILRNDFDSNINIKFVSINSILSAELTHDSLNNFDLVIDSKFKILSIPPLLINPNDKIMMKILIDSNSEMPFFVIESRIAGINKINNLNDRKSLVTGIPGLIMFSIMLISSLILLLLNLSNVITGIILMVTSIFGILVHIQSIRLYTKFIK